jgi:hypothetical protein
MGLLRCDVCTNYFNSFEKMKLHIVTHLDTMPHQKLHLPTFNAISNGNVVTDALRADQKEVLTNQKMPTSLNRSYPMLLKSNLNSGAKMGSRKWFLIEFLRTLLRETTQTYSLFCVEQVFHG